MAGPLLLILSIVVVTSREQIIELCEDLARHVDKGDVAAVGARLAADFEAGQLDRDEFVDRLERTLIRHRVDDPELRGFVVTFPAKNVGVAEFRASASVRSPELIYDRFTSRWRATCRRSGGEWKITKLESLPTPPLNIGDVRHWLER